mgnify:CR=1 FL=1
MELPLNQTSTTVPGLEAEKPQPRFRIVRRPRTSSEASAGWKESFAVEIRRKVGFLFWRSEVWVEYNSKPSFWQAEEVIDGLLNADIEKQSGRSVVKEFT